MAKLMITIVATLFFLSSSLSLKKSPSEPQSPPPPSTNLRRLKTRGLRENAAKVQKQEMRHFAMHMSQQQQEGGRGYDDQVALTMVTDNQGQQHLRKCCMEMRKLDENCRCEAIRVMMRISLPKHLFKKAPCGVPANFGIARRGGS